MIIWQPYLKGKGAAGWVLMKLSALVRAGKPGHVPQGFFSSIESFSGSGQKMLPRFLKNLRSFNIGIASNVCIQVPATPTGKSPIMQKVVVNNVLSMGSL